jgi:hypothetical protein
MITLKCTKTYTNGVTHAFYANDRKADAYMAEKDTEDREYGLSGEWTVEVKTVR